MPRKAAPPLCARKLHRVFAGETCWRCEQEDRDIPADVYRERRRLELGLGQPTDVLRVRTFDGQVIEHHARPGRRP